MAESMSEEWSSPFRELVGVIGGLGPAATLLLYGMVCDGVVPAPTRDDGHIPVLIYSNPQVNHTSTTEIGGLYDGSCLPTRDHRYLITGRLC